MLENNLKTYLIFLNHCINNYTKHYYLRLVINIQKKIEHKKKHKNYNDDKHECGYTDIQNNEIGI